MLVLLAAGLEAQVHDDLLEAFGWRLRGGEFAAGGRTRVLDVLLLGKALVGVLQDVQRLRSAVPLSKRGEPQTKTFEDIWLGSAVFRFPPPEPVQYVQVCRNEHFQCSRLVRATGKFRCFHVVRATGQCRPKAAF